MKTFDNNLYMLKCVAKFTPAFFCWLIADGIIWGLIHSFSGVVFIKILFDKIGENAPFHEITFIIGAMALFYLLVYLFCEWYWNFISLKAGLVLHQRMQCALFDKASGLDLASYDDPAFFNDFVWASAQSDIRAIAVARDVGRLLTSIIAVSVMVGVLLTIDSLVVAAICAAVSISVFLSIAKSRLTFARDVETRPLKRKADYIGRVFYLADYAKEIRLSRVEQVLYREFGKTVSAMTVILKRFGKKTVQLGAAQGIVSSLFFDTGIVILLVYKIMVEKSITVGGFAASVGATWKLYEQMNDFLRYIARFKEHSLYTEKFRVFMNSKATITDAADAKDPPDEFRGIALHNVSFAYPNTEKEVLKKISLTIKPKEKIAFVGYNGAGKSTLIKLILRLYDPTGGTVLMNETDVRTYTLHNYRNKFGAVFQDYQIYSASVAENVMMDEVSAKDNETVRRALTEGGFAERLASLPHGIDTKLLKEIDPEGVNLSGGEAQKVAIARIFAKPCDIMILDEPSSALDPISEYELNQAMLSAAFEKTVIFISHRLSTTRMADRIYMLEKGEIIEEGNHDELMKQNGKYAEMFRMQAEKYNREAETVAS